MNATLFGPEGVPTWLIPEQAVAAFPFYSPEAVLEIHLPQLDSEERGPSEIIPTLSTRWRSGASVHSCGIRESRGGIQARLELAWDDGMLVRERHLIHTHDGLITLHVIYPEPAPVVVGTESLEALSPELRTGLSPDARIPLAPGFSGAPLDRIVLENGRSLVVKHISPRWSWVMRATGDEGREALLWVNEGRPGFPADPAVVDAVRLPDRWLLYMEDVSDIVSTARPSTEDDLFLRSLARMYDATPMTAPEGLCSLEDRLALFSPATAVRERLGTDLGPKIVGRGWELVAGLIPPDVFDLAQFLAATPRPLARALSSRRCSLIHGDLRPGNLGMRGPDLVLIDWGLATWGPAILDLVWYLFNRKGSGRLDEGLAALSNSLTHPDERALDLAILATFIQVCPYFGFNAIQEPDPDVRATAHDELAQWVAMVRRSIDRSGHLIEL